MALGCQVDLVVYLTLLVVVLSPFAFRQNSSFRFYGKFMVYYVTASTIAIFLIPIFMLRPRDVANSRMSTYFTRHIAKLIGIEYKLENGEILAEDRGAFVVSNHQSTLDILGMFNIWEVPYKMAAVAKKEIFWVWPFGIAAWLGGQVFIDRSCPKKAYQSLKETSDLTTTGKTKIWVFPEGTRNKDVNKTKTLLPFRRGAFKMAVVAQAPIIPVVISPYYFLNHKYNYFGQGKIILKALTPIETKGLTESDVNDLMKQTSDIIQEAYEKLYSQVEATLPKTHPFFQH